MQPKTLSASSLSNWEECQAKFVASNLHFIPETGKKEAAKVGTAVHYALEHFVRDTCMDRTEGWGNLPHLLELYHEGFMDTFGSAAKTSSEYKDGLALTKKWYARTDLSEWDVDNVEEKKRIPIGDTGILLTYIFDRIDRRTTVTGKKILRVTDYKTIRRTYSYDEMRENLQVRIYALAAWLEYQEWGPDEVWVHLDLLRHDDIGIKVTVEENLETLTYLLDTARLIQGTDEKNATRTMGPGCVYCPIRATCPAVLSNAAGGGIMGLAGDLEATVLLLEQTQAQEKALKLLNAELAGFLMAEAQERDTTSFTVLGRPIKVKASSRRVLSDTSLAARIIGPELMATVGKLGIGDVEKIIDSQVLAPDQVEELEGLIVKNFSEPRAELGPIPPLKKKDAAK